MSESPQGSSRSHVPLDYVTFRCPRSPQDRLSSSPLLASRPVLGSSQESSLSFRRKIDDECSMVHKTDRLSYSPTLKRCYCILFNEPKSLLSEQIILSPSFLSRLILSPLSPILLCLFLFFFFFFLSYSFLWQGHHVILAGLELLI